MKLSLKILAIALIVIVLLFAVGRTNLTTSVSTGAQGETQTFTRIPLLLLCLVVAIALMLLGVVDTQKQPLSLMPALAIGLVLALVTNTPVLWSRFSNTSWLMPMASVVVLAIMTAQCIGGLLTGLQTREPLAFCSKKALQYSLVMLAAYLPGLLMGLANLLYQGVGLRIMSAWPQRVHSFTRLLLLPIASGFIGLFMVKGNCRQEGWIVLCLGAVSLIACLFFLFKGGVVLSSTSAMPVKLIYYSLTSTGALSLSSFLLFAGIGAMRSSNRPPAL